MPKLGRPFDDLETDLNQSSRNKRPYFSDCWSEVQRNAPFGTYYTPEIATRIVGSRYHNVPTMLAPLSPGTSSSRSSSTRRDQRTPTDNSQHRRLPVLPPILTERELDLELDQLTTHLPASQSQLSPKAVVLSHAEQLCLLRLTRREIDALPDFLQKLKRVYLFLARIDVNLTGLCSFKEFVDSCYENDLHMSLNLFRVISSLYVVPSRDTVSYVNYEKVVSFLGAIQKSGDVQDSETPRKKSVRTQSPRELWNEKRVYYHDEDCIDSNSDNMGLLGPLSPRARLPDILAADVGSRPIPVHEIRLACQRADPQHRGTLSVRQLVDICKAEGLRLSEAAFRQAVQHSRYMGGGQLSWENFLGLLERVQPIRTGLQIPSSKMPLDFVRSVPEPNSSWPHSEESKVHHTELPVLMESNRSVDQARSRDKKEFSHQYKYIEPDENQISIDENNSRFSQSRLNTSRDASSQTARSNDDPNLAPMQEPWYNRFIKFVDAVYLRDVQNQGILPTSQLYQVAMELNDKLHLGISTTEMVSALDGASVDNGRVYTNINSFLRRLAIR